MSVISRRAAALGSGRVISCQLPGCADTDQMAGDRNRSQDSAPNRVVLGRFAYFGTVPASVAGAACWAAILISDGPLDGLKYSWLLAIATYLALPPLLAKLRLDGSILRMTVIGPWRQSVDLLAMDTIRWRRTGGPASRGSMFIRDDRGGKVRIGVGDFTGVDTWGPLILSSAEKCRASVDDRSRQALQGAGRRDRVKSVPTSQDP